MDLDSIDLDELDDAAPAPRSWSPYQEAVFEFIERGRGHLVVEAVAGSGKSTTVREAAARVTTGSVAIFAFNVHIANEMKDRVPANVTVRTINSLGHGALGKVYRQMNVDGRKYNEIIENMLTMELEDEPQAYEVRSAVRSLVGYAQSNLWVPDMSTMQSEVKIAATKSSYDELNEIAGRYAVETPVYGFDWYADKVEMALILGIEAAHERSWINFDDQIYLPHIFGIKPAQYDYVFVDECQDLSRAKLELVMRACRPGGRMVFVGDSRQAIYAFAGADPQAWNEIIRRTNATVLPLSVCYRCPTKHLDLARNIVPQIEARPGAPEGVLEHMGYEKAIEAMQPGDMVLCRYTAPLVKLAFQLLRMKVPAQVRGRDIGRQIADFVRFAYNAQRGARWDEFSAVVNAHAEREIGKLKGRKNADELAARIMDRAEGALACYDAIGSDVHTVGEFRQALDCIFGDGEGSFVDLMTIHRAKGLEVEPDATEFYLTSPIGSSEQEENLHYVALTRSKHRLVLVPTPKRK